MSDQHLEKRQVPTPCTNTHTHVITHTHGRSQGPSFEITHTHTHRRGRQAGEMRRRGPNTIRRGEAGVESNHSRGRPLPAQNHKEVETRERERQHARLWASAVARRLFLFYHRPRRRIRNLRSPLSQIKTIKEPQLSLYCEGKRCIEFLPS